MRSLLFVPADSARKIERGMNSPADGVILDLEDSVVAENKSMARRMAAEALTARKRDAGKHFFVRINPLMSGLAEDDLDAVISAAPDGIVLPKANGGPDVMLLSAMLAAREAVAGLADGHIKIIALATETPAALFTLGSYADFSFRLSGLTWGAEDLSAAVGAERNRDTDGSFTDPYRLARSLTLMGAASAGVDAIDTVFVSFRDSKGLEEKPRPLAETDSSASWRSIRTRYRSSTGFSRRRPRRSDMPGLSLMHLPRPATPAPSASTTRCMIDRICCELNACLPVPALQG